MEAHCHRWRMSCADLVWMIIHLEYFLLLGCQIHSLAILTSVLLPIHYSKSHGSWNKNVVLVSDDILTIIRRLNLGLMHIISLLILIHLLEMLNMILLGVFVAVVGYISTCLLLTLSVNLAFLIVAIEILNVERTASLMIAETRTGTRLQSLILSAGSALSMEVFS